MERNINEIRNHFKSYFDILIENGLLDFFHNIVNLNNVNDRLLNNQIAIKIGAAAGATKRVFWIDDCVLNNNEIDNEICNYVFKVSFQPEQQNSCELEKNIYEYLKSTNEDEYFAWCDFFMTFEDIDFYIMERCSMVEDEFEEIAKINIDDIISNEIEYRCEHYGVSIESDAEKVESITKDVHDTYDGVYSGDSYDVRDYVLDTIWGCEEVDRFDCIVNKLGINDLHSGNFGRTKDGRYVVIDYSGYYTKITIPKVI